MSAPTRTDQFSGEPALELGSIRGLRSWRVVNDYHSMLLGESTRDDLFTVPQVLTSPVFSTYRWRDGENEVSACERCWLYIGIEETRTSRTYPVTPARIHPNCSCGFYAFTNKRDTFEGHGKMTVGVIEGYGLVTVGERGFRAQKAKIRGLVLEDDLLPESVKWLKAKYPSVQFFDTKEELLKEFPLPKRTVVKRLKKRWGRRLGW